MEENNLYKEELTSRLMETVNLSDGPELAYYYSLVCRCKISEEDAHYRHDEIVDEIEVMVNNMDESELTGLMEILGELEDEE